MVKKRGRLPGSAIRDNMVEILAVIGQIHGYDLYKHFRKVYGNASLRSIYYHLKKGTELGVFESKGIERIEGNFSWGSGVERKVFAASGVTSVLRGSFKEIVTNLDMNILYYDNIKSDENWQIKYRSKEIFIRFLEWIINSLVFSWSYCPAIYRF